MDVSDDGKFGFSYHTMRIGLNYYLKHHVALMVFMRFLCCVKSVLKAMWILFAIKLDFRSKKKSDTGMIYRDYPECELSGGKKPDFVLLILVSLLVTLGQASNSADAASLSEITPFKISAEFLFYSFDWQMIWSEASFTYTDESVTLTGERVLIDLEHGRLEATGNIVVVCANLQIKADSIKLLIASQVVQTLTFDTKIIESFWDVSQCQRIEKPIAVPGIGDKLPRVPGELRESMGVVQAITMELTPDLRLRCEDAAVIISGVEYPPLKTVTFRIGESLQKQGFSLDKFWFGSSRGLLTRMAYNYYSPLIKGFVGAGYESGLRNSIEKNLFQLLFADSITLSEYFTLSADGIFDSSNRYRVGTLLSGTYGKTKFLELGFRSIDELYGDPKNEFSLQSTLQLPDRTLFKFYVSGLLEKQLSIKTDLTQDLTRQWKFGFSAELFETYEMASYKKRKSDISVTWTQDALSASFHYPVTFELPSRFYSYGPVVNLAYRKQLLPNLPVYVECGDMFKEQKNAGAYATELLLNEFRTSVSTGFLELANGIRYQQRFLLSDQWTQDSDQTLFTGYSLAEETTLFHDIKAAVSYEYSARWDLRSPYATTGETQQFGKLSLRKGAVDKNFLETGVSVNTEDQEVDAVYFSGKQTFLEHWRFDWQIRYAEQRKDFNDSRFIIGRLFRTKSLNCVYEVGNKEIYIEMVSIR